MPRAIRTLASCRAAAAAATISEADQGAAKLRAPLDDRYIWSLVWQQRKSLLTAFAALVFCVGSNLASPVLSGVLFETLVKGQPFSK